MKNFAGRAGPLQIQKQTLHDQVADQIRDLIIEGYLEPGTRIDEADMVTQLGVSRTPFREALRTLAAEGLIVIRPARGSMVRKLSPRDVHSMLEVLAQLERLAGQTACERATDDEISELRAMHKQMLEHYRNGERMAYYKLNQEFHSRLSALSHNETLLEFQSNLQGRLKRIRFVGSGRPDKWKAAVAEHEQMMAALEARQGVQLGEIMAQHLAATWERVKDDI